MAKRRRIGRFKPEREGGAGYFEPAAPPVPGIAELAYAGTIMVRRAVPLPAHRHPTLEICYIESGMAQWWVERERVTVRGGQVILIRPHERHGGIGAVHQPCRYYFIGIRTEIKSRGDLFLGLPRAEGRALLRGLVALKERAFDGPAELARHWQGLLAVADEGPAQEPLSLLRARAALLVLLLAVVRAGAQSATPTQSVLVREAVKLMEAHLEAPLSLDEITHRLGWSISHFKARFRKELGIAPADFYLRRRIERACEWLREPARSLTGIGVALGFSSSQYFATAFKRITGETPSAYRRRVLDGA